MKNLLIILVLLIPVFTFGQNKSVFTSLSKIDNKQSIKILLVSADWCVICSKTKNLINSSKKIKSYISSNIEFFEFDIDKNKSVSLNNKTYHYVPHGVNSGAHEFHDFLFPKGIKVSYPAIIIFNSENEIIQRFSGYLTEKEWIRLLNSLAS